MIDTYGMDDINTQAIRELTTEVDGVKQKQAKDENNISNLQTNKMDKDQFIYVTKSPVDVPENGVIAPIYLAGLLPTSDYILISIVAEKNNKYIWLKQRIAPDYHTYLVYDASTDELVTSTTLDKLEMLFMKKPN